MYNSYGTFYHNGYSELYHHGVKGQSWGKRRYQNPDGSLTPEGRVHYNVGYKKKIIGGSIATAAGGALASGALLYKGAKIAKAGIALNEAESALNKNKDLQKFTSSMNQRSLDFFGYDRNKIIEEGKQLTKKVTSAAAALSAAKAPTILGTALPIVGGAAALAGLGIIGYGVYQKIKLDTDIENEALRNKKVKTTKVM
jgi:hypothetical protein